MTGVVGALVEAWDELRIHKLRVLLALIGVAVAVAAITGVTAAVGMLRQAMNEDAARWNGRQVSIQVQAWSDGSTAEASGAAATAAVTSAFEAARERYDITYATRDSWSLAAARFPSGTQDVQVRLVDPAFGTIYRVQPVEGAWFAADRAAYAPQLVVNQAFLTALGVADLSTHPTVLVGAVNPVRATVVGVVANQWAGATPEAYTLYDDAQRWGYSNQDMASVPGMTLWVPGDQADALLDAIRRDVGASVPGMHVDGSSNASRSSGIDGAARWVGIGVGAFALLLGGLGLVNIALVTVRHRIREIGVRRSFGATSGRIFFGVMLESVVATVVAGLVGVVIAVAVIKNIPVERLFGAGLQDMPPFPVSAALVGMACAVGIGALAGLLPATVAVRVKVIDAIRY